MSEYNSKKAIIFGYSGHAYIVLDILETYKINVIGYFEQKEQENNPFTLKYLGIEEEKNLKLISLDTIVFPAVGSNQVRKNLVEIFEKHNLNEIVIHHKSSILSSKSTIGKSTLISGGAVINPLVKIGKGCIINTSSVIEHECNIGDYCHIAPGAVLAGNVTVGNESFVGANSIIKQGVNIGENVIIGAGSVVLRDIGNNEVWVGNPAKRIK